MNERKRIYVMREDHIGFGIWWRRHIDFELEIGIALPFMVVGLGFGRKIG